MKRSSSMDGAVLAALIAALLATASPAEAEEPKPVDQAELQTLVEGNNRFGLDLYAKLRDEPGNLFLSPYSISSAFAMAYGGARGATAEEMAQVLHLSLAEPEVHKAFAALGQELTPQGDKPKYELRIANRLWGQAGYDFQDSYLALTRKYYGAPLETLDFVNQPEPSRERVNEWVEDRTNGKIEDLLPPGSVGRDTRLVLTNAIYFLGTWTRTFSEDATGPEPFHLTAEKQAKVPMMRQKSRFKLAETETLQVLELPYKGGDLSMLVLLPREIDGLADLEKSLTVERLADWREALKSRQVRVYLPKFKMTSDFSLGGTLKSLGMTRAFTPKAADFSGIDGTRDLYLTSAVHKAFVEVNERGTEAAAATGIIVGTTAVAPEPATFRADHPFLFLIADNKTGSILFLGRLADPRAEKD